MRETGVRRLVAVDMYGSKGATLRRRIVVAEFVVSAFVGLGLGAWVGFAATTPAWRVFGLWSAGIGVNYLVLVRYAVAIYARRSLEDELAGLDLSSQARHYSVRQLWLLVPCAFVVFVVRRQ